ncbi:hypothetical protein N825_36095 [Skermanella stibiiresistens SB22]|uniref:Acyltransferase n=1 Tax=Skermanella stibiiresistens SB22 TaxID=1385369 RepID=W9GTI6_9PROT|nr:hypothetical protein N825_36095 [Skermanella stibiiresistens SB22]
MEKIFKDVTVSGEGNELSCLTDRGDKNRLDIIGSRNKVQIGAGCKINEATWIMRGDEMSLILEDGIRFNGRINISGRGGKVVIGKNTTFERVNIVCIESANVIIGAECMFSFGIEIRTSDAHSIIDLATRCRINGPGDVIVGDHVWIGAHTTLNKGITIASDVIVGTRAVVTKDIVEEHCAAAGVPARVVRRDVSWDRKLVPVGEKP